MDANENIIAVTDGEGILHVYDYSGNLLLDKEVADYFLLFGDTSQVVCVNSKTISSGGDKGLNIYYYNGNLLLNYKFEDGLLGSPVYSIHCSEQLIGAGFGEKGYFLFRID